MARMDRLDLAGVPQHIVQRGNNRGACFFEDGHRRLFRKLMHQSAREAEVDLHAYVLMTNHVHMLGTPRHEGGVSRFMHLLGCRYVPVINRLCGRSGTAESGESRRAEHGPGVPTDRVFELSWWHSVGSLDQCSRN